MSTKPVIGVIGASGYIGKATVQTLSAKYADKFDIKVGVRNPDKLADLANLPGISIIQAEMGSDKLKDTLKGIESLYIVTPGAENRAPLTVSTAEAAKAAGVKFLLVVSVPTVSLTDTVFGKQCAEIEEKVSKLGVSHCFLRLPMFIDNNWGFKDGIQKDSSIYAPVDPKKPFTVVAVEDAAKAGATILTNYANHTNKTYTLVSDRYTEEDLAKAFTDVLGREVKYVRVPMEATKKAFLDMGFQQWQVNGMEELFNLVNAGAPETNYKDTTAFKTITGEEPTTIKQWVEKYGAAFK